MAHLFALARGGFAREKEEVHELRAARRFTREGQTRLSRENVDRGGLAGVGTPGKGDFRQAFGRKTLQLGRGNEKARAVENTQDGIRGRRSVKGRRLSAASREVRHCSKAPADAPPQQYDNVARLTQRDRGSDENQLLPKTSLICMETRTKVVRIVSSLRRRAPT